MFEVANGRFRGIPLPSVIHGILKMSCGTLEYTVTGLRNDASDINSTNLTPQRFTVTLLASFSSSHEPAAQLPELARFHGKRRANSPRRYRGRKKVQNDHCLSLLAHGRNRGREKVDRNDAILQPPSGKASFSSRRVFLARGCSLLFRIMPSSSTSERGTCVMIQVGGL